MTSFSFFKYFDAFELDGNVGNFVYHGKTRMSAPIAFIGNFALSVKNSLVPPS